VAEKLQEGREHHFHWMFGKFAFSKLELLHKDLLHRPQALSEKKNMNT
jgi:hypothetical protein